MTRCGRSIAQKRQGCSSLVINLLVRYMMHDNLAGRCLKQSAVSL
jgi:hypothetical protein